MNGKCGEADDRITLSTGYLTGCAANPTHYPWLQSLMKTRQTTYFHTRQNWTIIVYINYRIVSRLGIICKTVYTARSLSHNITPSQYNNRCTVSRLTMTLVHIRRKLRLDDAGSVCQFDHIVDIHTYIHTYIHGLLRQKAAKYTTKQTKTQLNIRKNIISKRTKKYTKLNYKNTIH